MTDLLPIALQNATLLEHLNAAETPPGPTAIATAIGRDKSNVAKSLKALEAAGLAEADVGSIASTGALRGWRLTEAGRHQLVALDRAKGGVPPIVVADGEGSITVTATASFAEIRLDLIERDPQLNPRQTFDEAELEGLAKSIAEKGVVQPILVPLAAMLDDDFSRQLRAVSKEPAEDGVE
ncbi:MAG TPA: ParB N-terminal domain-containing protein [Stellaceae bacterium]|nr:ParB N-terminal domain-containing protein [Stellaceae bacterium]